MPRRDRKRHDPDLEQYVELANALIDFGRPASPLDLPKPHDSASMDGVLGKSRVAALMQQFAVRWPASVEDRRRAVGQGHYVAAADAYPSGGYNPEARLAKRSKKWPPAVVLRAKNEPIVIADPRSLYSLAYVAFLTLGGIVSTLRAQPHTTFHPARALVPGDTLRGILLEHGKPMRLECDPYVDGMLPALTETQPDRIRVCPVCDRFFITKRGHAGGCSPECCAIERNRRLRQRQAAAKLELENKLAYSPESLDTKPVMARRKRRAELRKHRPAAKE